MRSQYFQKLDLAPGRYSPAELNSALQKALARKTLTDEERAQILGSYLILSDPELGERIPQAGVRSTPIQIAPEDREKIAGLLDPLDAPAAGQVRTVGSMSAQIAGDMATFYLAVGVTEFWKCYRNRDPVACDFYLQSLKEPSGHIGFLLFMGASHMTRQLALRLLGDKVLGQTAAGFLGLAGGSLVNQVFVEIANNPETALLWKAQSIKDPGIRGKKREEAFHALWSETFGRKDWYEEKVPMIAGLFAASLASGASWKLVEKMVGKISDSIRPIEKPADLRIAGCVIDSMQASPRAPISHGKEFLRRRLLSFGQIMVFLGWSDLINPRVEKAWDTLTFNRNLQKSRQTLHEGLEKGDISLLIRDLAENSKLWNLYRRKQMSDVEQIMAMHLQELNQLEQKLNEPHLFYQWAIDGFSPDDPSWENLRDTYYSEDTKPQDIDQDTKSYLKGFFCGVDPAHAVHEVKNVAGMPLPWDLSPTVEPFRVVAKRDWSACKLGLAGLKSKIAQKDYSSELLLSYSNFQVAAFAVTSARRKVYEARVDQKLIRILDGAGVDPVNSGAAPDGVIPAFNAQLKDLRDLALSAEQSRIASAAGQSISDQIRQITEERQAALDLRAYMATPSDQRVPPQQTLDEILAALDSHPAGGSAKDGADWQGVVQYFNGFIFH